MVAEGIWGMGRIELGRLGNVVRLVVIYLFQETSV